MKEESPTPIRVTMFMRHPGPGAHSIEGVFAAVRDHLPEGIDVECVALERPSSGLFPRLGNMLQAWRRRGELNHVTGDVHYLTLALPRNSTILTIPDLRGLAVKSGLRKWILYFFWYRLPVKKAMIVTTISQFTARELVALLPGSEKKVVHVDIPISSRFFKSRIEPEIPKTGDSRDSSHSALVIGTKDNKNLIRIFQAVRGLDLTLFIIGHLNDIQKDELRKQKITFRNFVDLPEEEIISVYSRSSLLMFPSLYEGFGMPIVEAQALGVPVITSDREPMRTVAGNAAILVDPEHTDSIRAATIQILQDDRQRKRLIAAGRENARRFHPDLVAAQYATLYRDVASWNADRKGIRGVD